MQSLAHMDRFEIVGLLGEGAMGVVYQAVDRERNARVAVKMLRNLDGDALFRFKNEFRSVQGLQHPNLVSLGELIEFEGEWLFTMELVEGTDFYSYVRPRRRRESDAFGGESTAEAAPTGRQRPRFDETRLRGALQQLARGLRALHRAGFVHRDVKPSNIMVANDGRVVLLDFGFVTAAAQRSSDRVVGTAAYMAPEQALSPPIGPEADWYAVGAVLYEALTGRPPLEGMPVEILMRKQHETPRRPSELVEGVPEDLEELCMGLLAIAPEARPKEAAILERLGADDDLETPVPSSSLSLSRRPFFGREEELGELHKAFNEADGRCIGCFLHGESGIGKSSLVHRFARDLSERAPRALVLDSRCYERESVPFKAFDGIIDAISRHVVELEPVDAAMLIPVHVAQLTEVFPVLKRAEVFARAAGATDPLPPAEQRQRLFTSLRDLFARLANARDVVIIIDDFQWADADSLALLRALFRQPGAPPLLLVASIRESSGVTDAADATFTSEMDEVRHIYLRGLPASDADRLAAHLLAQTAPSLAAQASSIVSESSGHPLFIEEMIRYAAIADHVPDTLQLEQALWARVVRLEDEARAVLEIIATAEVPIQLGLTADACQRPYDEFSRWVSVLRIGNLVQTTGVRRDDTITVFHDRIREAVIRNMPPERRRDCHRRLAVVLESAEAGYQEALAIHWLGAGEPDKAFFHTLAVADQASRLLAFERAARLYRRCIELLPHDHPDIVDLRAKLGEALANAGRSAEAANTLLQASKMAGDRSVELAARAATEFIRSGHVDSGLEVLRTSLDSLGIKLSSTPGKALARLAARRAWLRGRGLRFRPREERMLSEFERTRIDTTYGFSVGLGMVDTIRGADVQSMALLLALRAGEPMRVARALASEAAFRLASGRSARKSGYAVLERARAIAAEVDDPRLGGVIEVMAGIGALCQGEYLASAEHCQTAEKMIRGQRYGLRWEISTARIIGLWSCYYLGELAAVQERVAAYLNEALESGDLYAATTYWAMFRPLAALADDDPARARTSVDRSLRRWSQRGFHFQHYCQLLSHTHVEIYAGRGAAAVERLDEDWPQLKSSLHLSVQQSRIEARHLRARALIAAAAEHGGGRSTYLARAEADVRAIAKERCEWADGMHLGLRAALAFARGDTTAAIQRLRAAAEAFDRHHLSLYAAAARLALGAAIGGDEGGALRQEARAAFSAQKIAAPERMAAMLLPGCPT